jgi:hypothetical protein
MAIRSKRGAIRRYNALLNRCFRDMRGGLQFGMDWRTLRITFPERYAELLQIKDLYPTLPG